MRMNSNEVYSFADKPTCFKKISNFMYEQEIFSKKTTMINFFSSEALLESEGMTTFEMSRALTYKKGSLFINIIYLNFTVYSQTIIYNFALELFDASLDIGTKLLYFKIK